jgi:intracellular multiplication protein IcmD
MMCRRRLFFKILFLVQVLLLLCAQQALAESPQGSIGAVAKRFSNMAASFKNLIITVAFVSGVGFTIAAVFKLKQHKENPQNVPIGTVFALFFVSILLINMPLLLVPTIKSIFGSDYDFSSSSFQEVAVPN